MNQGRKILLAISLGLIVFVGSTVTGYASDSAVILQYHRFGESDFPSTNIRIKQFENDHDDYSAIMLKALADRFAEAFAERLHERIRTEFWGYSPDESFDNEHLIKESYKGIRPAPGYPSCPDHTEKDLLWKLLRVEENTGIVLTESYAMYPTASVSGWYFSHPDSRYFGLGKINRDQVNDYAQRKNSDLKIIEKWLSPSLGYNPEDY